MSLNDRIARLEAKRRPSSLPVELDDGQLRAYAEVEGLREIIRVADGARWSQAEGEPLQAFVDRAKREAAHKFRPASAATAIRLVALRPRLTQTQWLVRYGLATPT